MANGWINSMTPSQQAVSLSVLSHNFATGLHLMDKQVRQVRVVLRLNQDVTISTFLWPVLGLVGP